MALSKRAIRKQAGEMMEESINNILSVLQAEMGFISGDIMWDQSEHLSQLCNEISDILTDVVMSNKREDTITLDLPRSMVLDLMYSCIINSERSWNKSKNADTWTEIGKVLREKLEEFDGDHEDIPEDNQI